MILNMTELEVFQVETEEQKVRLGRKVDYIRARISKEPEQYGYQLHQFLMGELNGYLTESASCPVEYYRLSSDLFNYLARKLGRSDLHWEFDVAATGASLERATRDTGVVLARNGITVEEDIVSSNLALGDCMLIFSSALWLLFNNRRQETDDFISLDLEDPSEPCNVSIRSSALHHNLVRGEPVFVESVDGFIVIADRSDLEAAVSFHLEKLETILECLSAQLDKHRDVGWLEEMHRGIIVYLSDTDAATGGMWASYAKSSDHRGVIIYGIKPPPKNDQVMTIATGSPPSEIEKLHHKCGEVAHEIGHLIEGRQYGALRLEQNKICAEIGADDSRLSFLKSINASPGVIEDCERGLRKYLEFVCGNKLGVFRLDEWKLALWAFRGVNDREVWRSVLTALDAPLEIIGC